MTYIGMIIYPHHLSLLGRIWRVIDSERDLSLSLTISSLDVFDIINKEYRFDVFVIDSRLERYGRLKAAVQKVKRLFPAAAIVVLHDHLRFANVRDLYSLGALVHIDGRNIETNLARGIFYASNGETYLDGGILPSVISSNLKVYSSSPRDYLIEQVRLLTPREKDIFFAMADGLSYQEIAGKFGIAVKTVRGYRTTIYRKMEFKNSVELFRAAQTLRNSQRAV